MTKRSIHQKYRKWNFAGGTVDKNPPANAGNMVLIPGPGRCHMSLSKKPVQHNPQRMLALGPVSSATEPVLCNKRRPRKEKL